MPVEFSRFTATPEQIDFFLRQHFSEDRIYGYQAAIAKEAVTAGVAEIRSAAQSDEDSEKEVGHPAPHKDAELMREVADLIDPARDAGPFLTGLVAFDAPAPNSDVNGCRHYRRSSVATSGWVLCGGMSSKDGLCEWAAEHADAATREAALKARKSS